MTYCRVVLPCLFYLLIIFQSSILFFYVHFPDVFHWSCAEASYRALPRTTAPAGYQCPSCATPVFPPPNLVSPVADELRAKLAGVNWARAGLGLPLVIILFKNHFKYGCAVEMET